MKIISLKFLFFFLLFLVLPILSLSAQTSSLDSFVTISISPENPAPNQQVKVSLQSYSQDLNRAKITWSVNGAEKKTELGLKEYFVQSGIAGKLMTVSARSVMADGKVINKEVSFIPAGVDLLFEAVSYIPPFYKGKALNSNQGTVVVVAFPEMFSQGGQKFKTRDLIYNWKKNDLVVQGASGVGKNTFTFSGSVPVRDATIEVTATSLDQSITAKSSVTITTGLPKIIFYESSPIYGIMTNKAVKNTVKMLTDEFSVIAVPYFFSAGYATTPDLDYVWSLNGQAVANQEPKNSFTVRQEKAGSGTANIGLKINNNVRIFQFTDKGLVINFEKQ